MPWAHAAIPRDLKADHATATTIRKRLRKPSEFHGLLGLHWISNTTNNDKLLNCQFGPEQRTSVKGETANLLAVETPTNQ